MNNKQLLEYLVAGKLANMAYTIADQAKYARNAGEITQEQYAMFLPIMHRVHTSYSLQMDKIESQAKEYEGMGKAVTLAVITGFSLALLASTILMWGIYG